MDIESIGKAGAKSDSVESIEVSMPSYTETVQRSQPIVKKVSKSEKENQGNGSKKEEHAPSEATISDSVARANRHMERTHCEYSYHEKTKRVSIKVLDDETGEVIREIPPEKSLDMLQKMWEMAGIVLDERR